MSDGFAEPGLTAEALAATPRGADSGQATERLRRDCPNRVPRPRPPSPLRQLAAQMTHFFAVMLWVAALLVAGMPQLAIAIVVVPCRAVEHGGGAR